MRITKTEKTHGDRIKLKIYVGENEVVEVKFIDEKTGALLQTTIAYDGDRYTQDEIARFMIERELL